MFLSYFFLCFFSFENNLKTTIKLYIQDVGCQKKNIHTPVIYKKRLDLQPAFGWNVQGSKKTGEHLALYYIPLMHCYTPTKCSVHCIINF